MILRYLVVLNILVYCNAIDVLFWNLRTFGTGRATPEIGKQLHDIVTSSDIIMFAELKDAECYTGNKCFLKDYFNTYLPDFTFIMSPPLHYCNGYINGAEEYGFLVKSSLNISTQLLFYPDNECLFIRTPYALYVNSSFIIVVFHSMPGNANELEHLGDVITYFSNVTKNVILLGDLNTGCKYTSFVTLDKYPIRMSYDWLLRDDDFTNIHLNCPYDRIISTKELSSSVFGSRVLKEANEASRIGSDHYPIATTIHLY